MLTQNLRIGLTISALTATSLLFNNMDFFKWDTMILTPLEAVNETHRASHARELLGANYEISDASKVAGSARLSEHIHDKVLKALPPQWKDQARTISRALILESERYAMDPVLLLAVIRTESRFNPTIRGGHGEIGLMQIKPDTAQWIAKKFELDLPTEESLFDPVKNIKYGTAYLSYLRSKFTGDASNYIAAYNMGPRNVKRLRAQNIKPEIYSGKVMGNYVRYYKKISYSDNNLLASIN